MRNAARLTACLALLAGLPAAVTAQSADDRTWMERCAEGGDDRARFCDVRVERVAARGALTVDPGRNGGAVVIGSDRSDIEVHARIQASASSEERARELARAVTIDTNGTLSADGPDTGRREHWTVSFVVYVPRQLDVTATTHNGPVAAHGITGRIRLESRNGPVTLANVAGDVRAITYNGPLHVELTGSRWQGAGLDAETRNGPVTLEVPDGYNAQLETGTINGPMSSDVPLMVRSIGRRSHLDATLGAGGTKLRVVTRNGPFILKRS